MRTLWYQRVRRPVLVLVPPPAMADCPDLAHGGCPSPEYVDTEVKTRKQICQSQLGFEKKNESEHPRSSILVSLAQKSTVSATTTHA